MQQGNACLPLASAQPGKLRNQGDPFGWPHDWLPQSEYAESDSTATGRFRHFPYLPMTEPKKATQGKGFQ